MNKWCRDITCFEKYHAHIHSIGICQYVVLYLATRVTLNDYKLLVGRKINVGGHRENWVSLPSVVPTD